MRLITANIGRKSSIAGVWADIRKIRRQAPLSIVGWQEIDEGDPARERKILGKVLGKFNAFVGGGTRVPITVPRRRYRVLRRNIVFGSKGIPRVSPARLVAEAVVQDKRNEAITFVVINLHYPPGAFNKKIEPTQKAREAAWQRVFEVHKARVKYWNDKGYTVFWVGDVNRMAMPKAHPKEVRVVTAGIDSISYIQGDIRVRVEKKGTIVLNSDHNAQWAEFRLFA